MHINNNSYILNKINPTKFTKNIAMIRLEDFVCGNSNFSDKNETKLKNNSIIIFYDSLFALLYLYFNFILFLASHQKFYLL